MNRHLRFVPAVVVITAGLLAGAATPAAGRALSSPEVRAQFAECGYEIGNPGSPSSSPYVIVRDPGTADMRDADYRILMAIVYRDIDAASAAHWRAHRDAEQQIGEQRPFSNDNGPQLLSGYSGSVWRDNIALVQSSSRFLSSMYSYDSEADETRVARPDLFVLSFVNTSNQYAVDRDFVSCLEEIPGSPAVAPVFLQGHPW